MLLSDVVSSNDVGFFRIDSSDFLLALLCGLARPLYLLRSAAPRPFLTVSDFTESDSFLFLSLFLN